MICKTLGGAFIALKGVFKMNKKSKKLWGLKVGRVQGEKKKKKTCFVNWKFYFFSCYFFIISFLLHFKMIFRTLGSAPITF
jgi:hypothetical protein